MNDVFRHPDGVLNPVMLLFNDLELLGDPGMGSLQ